MHAIALCNAAFHPQKGALRTTRLVHLLQGLMWQYVKF